jgi:hypothetical protein
MINGFRTIPYWVLETLGVAFTCLIPSVIRMIILCNEQGVKSPAAFQEKHRCHSFGIRNQFLFYLIGIVCINGTSSFVYAVLRRNRPHAINPEPSDIFKHRRLSTISFRSCRLLIFWSLSQYPAMLWDASKQGWGTINPPDFQLTFYRRCNQNKKKKRYKAKIGLLRYVLRTTIGMILIMDPPSQNRC